jgi:hypothetical protein
VAASSLFSSPVARAQQLTPDAEERLKMLADPEGIKKKLEKEKERPPLEFFKSQVAPFDMLPYAKPNHWITLSIDMRANRDDYVGWLQSAAIPLLGMPQQIIHRRDARLPKDQRSRLGLQMMFPENPLPKDVVMELIRPDSIRADDIWPASLRTLEPHQMAVLVLTKGANDVYSPMRRLQSMSPYGIDRADPIAVERQRYYQMVLPLEPDKLYLSPHPLTWTPVSHVIWDGMPPDRLNIGQWQAMIDWIHWGGQLIIVGGTPESYELLRDSFLAPYLPAEPTGENALLKQADLGPLSTSYPPPAHPPDLSDQAPIPTTEEEIRNAARRYRAHEPIIPASNRPLFVAGLRPMHPDAVKIPMGEGSPHVLGIEQRMGRGRILMLSVSLTDPALLAWPGFDTLFRRVVLRRPEEPRLTQAFFDQGGVYHPPAHAVLGGPDLSWVRLLTRDLGASANRPLPYMAAESSSSSEANQPNVGYTTSGTTLEDDPTRHRRSNLPVAEWIDSATLPKMTQKLLSDASGITVPSSTFVLKVIVAYLLALVPLNWVVCRYGLRRRELAWVVVPVLALGFAVGVERAAAYDIGYDIACDEIDVLENFSAYSRAHITRFSSLYSTGRLRYTISYPDDPTALALPMISGTYLKGQEYSTTVWRSSPVPSLEGFQVQPRTLGMVRTEQLSNFAGSIGLTTGEGPRRLVNDTDLELRDAVVIDITDPKHRREVYLGTVGPKSTVEVKANGERPGAISVDGPAPAPILQALREYAEPGPENSGEIRLVAWSPKPLSGQAIEPRPDRHRGFTAVVVHLRTGPPPSPDGATYNGLAADTNAPVPSAPEISPDSVPVRGRRSRVIIK